MLTTFKGATKEALLEIEEEKKIRLTDEVFLLFSLGSQFDHLIKLALGKLGVFCLVADPASVTAEDVKKVNPIGIILSGGPASVHAEPPKFDSKIFDLGIPVLGICLGFQLWAQHIGLNVELADHREFGVHEIDIRSPKSDLFRGCAKQFKALQSHGDIVTPDPSLQITARSDNSPVAAAEHKHLHGVQFHPEVTHTEKGLGIFENFCFLICDAKDRFPAEAIAEKKIHELRTQIGDKKVLLALSGGSDSSTVAYLLKEALQEHEHQIKAVYVKGIDRPDDETYVLKHFGNVPWLDLNVVDAAHEFLDVLVGKHTMPDKRVAMRSVYKEILDREAHDSGASYIVQGTLYTDISESGGGYASGARKARIKLHHNVKNDFALPELTPLDDCVKDGGRNIGRTIGVPEELLTRHPFPGPGLVIRIEGEVTEEKLMMARAVDGIYIEELRAWDLYYSTWQSGAVVTKSEATYTKGDDAGVGPVIALWAVWSVDGFTAEAAKLLWNFLDHVQQRITNEVPGIAAVVYRISGKPPSTIEWG